MAQRGRRPPPAKELREIVDLYEWGMQVWMIAAFYDLHKTTIREYVKRAGRKVRISGQPKSIQPRKRVDAARRTDPFEGVYRSVREHARALQDRHTAQRRAGASIHSCQAEAS